MFSVFAGIKVEDTSKDGTLNTFINTFIFREILPACAKEYLTAVTYYCRVKVKVCNRIAAVDAIFPPVCCSGIISKQYGGRRVGL